MTRSWLRAERVLLPDGRVAPARVAIEGTRIVAVEEGSAAAPGDRDLGDRLLLPELTTGSVDAAYRRAMDVLLRMAALETAGLDIPHYDAALLQEELGRFPAWFAEALLGHVPDEQERGLLRQVDSLLVASALEQPQVLVHRDFHSRNLMPQADGALAVIASRYKILAERDGRVFAVTPGEGASVRRVSA